MKQNKLFKLWLLAVVMLAGSMGVSGETITITGADMSTTDGAQAITKSGIDFNGFMKQYQTTKIWFTSGTGYIYNSTSLGSINKITLSYNSGGSAASIQRFNVGSSAMSSYLSTGGSTVTTSTGGNTYEYTGGSGFGFFNISVSSKNLQLVSIVIDYTPGSTSATAAPTFTPPAGIYTSVQSVTLSSTTTGAKIYYTTDGTEPTSGSTLYTGAINVAATTTIKAIAYDASNANPSAVVEAVYTIDIFPSITVTPATTSAITNVEIGKTASRTLTVNGVNLTEDLSVSLTGDVDQFSLSTTTLAQTDGKVTDGKVTITYAPTAVGSHSVVVTISSQGITPFTRTISGNSINPPLVAPTATDATGISQTGFTANWNAVSGAESYKLDVYTKTSTGSVTATDLFFSEYIEGSSNNKYLEIYNGTGANVDLSDYKVVLYSNGSTTPGYTLSMSGVLANGVTYVIKHSEATLYAGTATESTVTYFNGDDAVALEKISTGTYVDIIGRIGEDPGTQWVDATDATLKTQDKTLVRKPTVTSGVTTNPAAGFPTLSTEWISYDIDVVTDLGKHTLTNQLMETKTPITGSPFTTTSTSQAVSGLANTGIYFYTVTAVRGAEESPLSNEIGPISLTATGLSNAKVDALAWTSSGKVMLNASAGEVIEIFNVAGQKVVSRPAVDGLNSVDVSAKGVVIVKVNNRISKVIL